MHFPDIHNILLLEGCDQHHEAVAVVHAISKDGAGRRWMCRCLLPERVMARMTISFMMAISSSGLAQTVAGESYDNGSASDRVTDDSG